MYLYLLFLQINAQQITINSHTSKKQERRTSECLKRGGFPHNTAKTREAPNKHLNLPLNTWEDVNEKTAFWAIYFFTFFKARMVNLVITCSAYAQAGPSNCTKKAGTSGAGKKKKRRNYKQKGGGDLTAGRTNRSHSGFLVIHRNPPQ